MKGTRIPFPHEGDVTQGVRVIAVHVLNDSRERVGKRIGRGGSVVRLADPSITPKPPTK
jgi:hypothetical protein